MDTESNNKLCITFMFSILKIVIQIYKMSQKNSGGSREDSGKIGLKLNIQRMKIMASSPTTSWQIDGKKCKQWQSLLSCPPKSLWMMTAAMKLKDTCSLEEKL